MPLSRRQLILAGVALIAAPVHAGDGMELVATTGMIADALRQVGGPSVNVQALMGPGVDPHLYRQTRSDIVAMTRADAVFRHGLHLEAQLDTLMNELAGVKRVEALAEHLPKERLIAQGGYADRFDPHVWMDPSLWSGVIAAARDALIGMEPAQAQAFRTNADRHLEEVGMLLTYARKVLGSVPETARALVTAHDAFAYFGRVFGFEVMGIQGISTESEAGLRHIEDLVSHIVDRNIGAIFVESSVPERNIRALIEGAAARGHQVRVGGELFSDAMGQPGTYEGTYIGMIDHNVTTIARALGGEAPERGMQGRLGA